MTLDAYLRLDGKTAEALAAETGLSVASISRIRNRVQKPSYDAIRSIVAATAGKVQADDLLGLAA